MALRNIDLTNKCGSCCWFRRIGDTASGECLRNPYGDSVVHDPKHPYWVVTRSRIKCIEYNAKPMTNADRLNAMSIEERAEFLYSIAYSGETPWSKPFAEKFCDQCPAPEYTLDDGRKLCLHECEFKDDKCPHGTDIVWWLQQPAEEAQCE